MAKSDSFFIRASVDGTLGAFAETTIDLGAYVDALGKSVLRIHNINYSWGPTASAGGASDWDLAANASGYHVAQLTTQSQTTGVVASNKSVIGKCQLHLSNDTGTANRISMMSMDADVGPERYENGYLVATENIFLGLDLQNIGPAASCYVILECTVETMSQAAAMALALSQQ
jgi:hypothetical protein